MLKKMLKMLKTKRAAQSRRRQPANQGIATDRDFAPELAALIRSAGAPDHAANNIEVSRHRIARLRLNRLNNLSLVMRRCHYD